MRRLRRLAVAGLVLLGLLPGAARGVTIYRIGGESLAPPPEFGRRGVLFRQLPWAVSRDGDVHRLETGSEGIRPRQAAAFASLPLRDANPHLPALFDWNALTCGVCATLTLDRYRCGACRGLYGEQGVLNFDLGDALFVEGIRLRSGDEGGLGILEDFGLLLSPVPLARDAGPLPPYTLQVTGNRKDRLDLTDLPRERRTAAIQLAVPEHEQPVQVNEVFVYASGATAFASYTSDIVNHDRQALWGGLRWSLQSAPDSRVTVSVRGGDQAETLRYWRYTGIGDQVVEVTSKEYDALRSGEKAGASYNYESWTGWGPSYDLTAASGAPTMPASQRRALQVRVEFTTSGVEGSRLGFVEFRASDPAVSAVVGELEPIQVEPGVLTEFSYILKPSLSPGNPGFDRLRIAAVAAHVDAVLGVSVDDADVPFTVVEHAASGFTVGLPRVTEVLTDAPVEVRFRARVLRYGAAFAGYLSDSARPYDVEQPIPAGDAVDEVFSDRVWIETRVTVRSVLASTATPATITPNGDGVNDTARLAVDLFETTGEVPLSLVIHDLGGRTVRTLLQASRDIGHYELDWDGRDDDGALVIPGIYVYRAAVRVGGNDAAHLGVVHVVY